MTGNGERTTEKWWWLGDDMNGVIYIIMMYIHIYHKWDGYMNNEWISII